MPVVIDNVTYNEYGVEQTLLPNNRYTVYLDIRDLRLKFTFSSLYNPLYSTAEIVRDDLGLFAAGMTDDEINRHTFLASREAQELAHNPEAIPGEPPFDYDNPPYHVRQYVRYKAAYKIAAKQYASMAKEVGTVTELGDLTVERRYTLRDLRDLLKLLREELAPWEAMLRGQTNKGRATAMYAVRGSLNDSPLAIERTDF